MADARAPPDRRDSSATSVFSLQQLDPQPIDSPGAEREKLNLGPMMEDEVPEEDMETSTASTIKPGSTTSAPGLSGSGRGAIYYLTRIQKYSSYATGLFTSLHLCNVSLIPATTGSVEASETYLLLTREIYQTALAEPLVVALPFLAHIASGVALRLIRRSQNVKRYGGRWWTSEENLSSSNRSISSNSSRTSATSSPWPPMSYISISGYAFTVLYTAHAITNRALPVLVEGDSSNIGLAYVSHGFARHPWVSYLAYLPLLAVGAGHMVWGAAKWLGVSPSTRGWLSPRNGGEASSVVDRATRRQRRKKWLGIHGFSVGVFFLWAVGGIGVVAQAGPSSGWMGKLYDGLFARVGL